MAVRKLLADKFKSIENTLNNYRNYAEVHFMEHLNKHFEFLASVDQYVTISLSNDEKIMIEEYKFLIMKGLRNVFQPVTVVKFRPKPSWFKRLFGYFFTGLGPLFAGLAGYLGCSSLIELMGNAQHPAAIALSIVFGIIEGLIFIGSDVRLIAKSLGISFFKTKPLLETYNRQLEMIKATHTHLLATSNVNNMSVKQYTSCIRLVKQFNDDVKEKQARLINCYQPTPLRQMAKKVARGIEGTLSIGTGFLTGKFLVGLFSAALVATPLGLALCGVTALFFFASYYYLRDRKVGGIVDRLMGEPKKLLREQAIFLEDEEGVQKFNHQTGLILAQKKTQELEKQLLYNKIYSLQKMLPKPKRLIDNRLFKRQESPTNETTHFPQKCRSHC